MKNYALRPIDPRWPAFWYELWTFAWQSFALLASLLALGIMLGLGDPGMCFELYNVI